MMTGCKLLPLVCPQGFPIIYACDLVFDPKWPSFELDLELIGLNILTKFHDDWM